MSERRCWTCGSSHDLDEACAQSSVARSARAAGGEAAVSSLLFGGVPSRPPVIVARFESDCSADCAGWIDEGDEIRSDGDGGWVHANGECDR
jgi:hypothetical protein